MDGEKDRIARAYARLLALRNSLPNDDRVHERYVREFHGALDHLAVRFDVEEFRVLPEDIGRRWEATNRTGQTEWSKDTYVDRALLMAKLDAVLTYFEIVMAKPQPGSPPQLGFHGRPAVKRTEGP